MNKKNSLPVYNLDEHLAQEHKRTPFSMYLREIVYGGNDGIITTFAVVAGFAGAQTNVHTAVPLASVLLFGLANLFADGLSMSLGSFLSLRADQEVYGNEKSKETHELLHNPKSERAETIEILRRRNFSQQDAETVATIYEKNTPYWTEFMMNDELQMANPEHEKPHYIATATFFAFVLFGIIPLIPYLFGKNDFALSTISTGIAFLLLGLLRSVVARQHALRGVLETLLVGGVAATVAYFVGTFFR